MTFTVHDGTKKALHCTMCEASFSVPQTLKKHIAAVHEGKKPFTCNLCSTSFSEKGNLLRHVYSVHEKIKPHECSICHKNYESKQYLKKHVESVHEGKKPHSCSLCGYAFAHKCHLYKHVRLTHGIQTDDYKKYYPDSNSEIVLEEENPLANPGEIKQEMFDDEDTKWNEILDEETTMNSEYGIGNISF